MKRIISFVILLSFYSISYSQDILAKYTAGQFIADKYEQDALSSFMTKSSENLFLEVDMTMLNTILELDLKNRDLIRQYISKYFEWSKKADSAKIDANKSIGTFTCNASFNNNSGWHFSDDVVIDFIFYSMKAPSGNIKCELAINIPSMVANDNKFIETKFKQVWLGKDNCRQLLVAISEELINARNKKIRSQNEILK